MWTVDSLVLLVVVFSFSLALPFLFVLFFIIFLRVLVLLPPPLFLCSEGGFVAQQLEFPVGEGQWGTPWHHSGAFSVSWLWDERGASAPVERERVELGGECSRPPTDRHMRPPPAPRPRRYASRGITGRAPTRRGVGGGGAVARWGRTPGEPPVGAAPLVGHARPAGRVAAGLAGTPPRPADAARSRSPQTSLPLRPSQPPPTAERPPQQPRAVRVHHERAGLKCAAAAATEGTTGGDGGRGYIAAAAATGERPFAARGDRATMTSRAAKGTTTAAAAAGMTAAAAAAADGCRPSRHGNIPPPTPPSPHPLLTLWRWTR